MLLDPVDLDAGDTLALLEDRRRTRRQAEVEDLLLVLHWADLHSSEPYQDRPGGERLDELGGDGTPGVQELSLCELAISRAVHPLAARSAVADALDLRHRLPHTWFVVLTLDAEPWVARKVASMSRLLSYDAVHVVDEAVAAAIAGQAPSRVLDLAAAKIIEADLAAHEARVERERARRFVGLTRVDEHGLRTVIARVTSGDALWVDATPRPCRRHHCRASRARRDHERRAPLHRLRLPGPARGPPGPAPRERR